MSTHSIIQSANTILYCIRWEDTVAFYRHRIGFEIAYQNDWLVEFRLNPTAFLSVADQSRTTMSSAGGQGLTLSFQIDNLEAAHRRWARAGLAPTGIRSQVMGGNVFYLFDPEGTRIEFWCPCP
jgi:predicted enzyme related to lactoylglutathione lyase